MQESDQFQSTVLSYLWYTYVCAMYMVQYLWQTAEIQGSGVTGRQFYTGLPSVSAGESGGGEGGAHSAHSLLLSPQ
jgi:hypothetical protein